MISVFKMIGVMASAAAVFLVEGIQLQGGSRRNPRVPHHPKKKSSGGGKAPKKVSFAKQLRLQGTKRYFKLSQEEMERNINDVRNEFEVLDMMRHLKVNENSNSNSRSGSKQSTPMPSESLQSSTSAYSQHIPAPGSPRNVQHLSDEDMYDSRMSACSFP